MSPRETRRERLANIANTEVVNTEIFRRSCITIDQDVATQRMRRKLHIALGLRLRV